MRVLPILFNSDMVRAILDGRKTVTRRVVKFPVNKFTNKIPTANNVTVYQNMMRSEKVNFSEKPFYCFDVKPPCQPGDILYVRETWLRIESCIYCMCYSEPPEQDGCYLYRATHGDAKGLRWRPSIHMPKAAARIWLKVTNVRVERLQDITEEQAKAEGANWKNGKNVGWEEKMRRTATDRFAELWDSTIKKSNFDRYGWDANPWVWRIEFERCEKPEED